MYGTLQSSPTMYGQVLLRTPLRYPRVEWLAAPSGHFNVISYDQIHKFLNHLNLCFSSSLAYNRSNTQSGRWRTSQAMRTQRWVI